MKLIDKGNYRWLADKTLEFDSEDDSTVNLSGYMGVTKLMEAGQENFASMLKSIHGKEKAKKILKECRTRGNKIHTELETNDDRLSRRIRKKLGKHLGSEILVYTTVKGVRLLGFIDAVYRNLDGDLILVDYKTKKRKCSFKNIESAIYRANFQLSIYSGMFTPMYGEKVSKMATVVLYADGTEPYLSVSSTELAQNYLPDIQSKLDWVIDNNRGSGYGVD